MSEESRIPYAASVLAGRRILALAAHPDDEVAGPGGALALAGASADAVRVWIATDGTRQEGAPSGAESEAAYAQRRRQESIAAAAILGFPPPEFAGFPDRGLSRRTDDLRGAIERLFSEVRPDLVFCPSPVEIHPDHRALAEALYSRVAGSRAEDADHDLYRYVRVAFYEISHPLLPNVLVDIDSVASRKTAALAAFSSQQAVRDYAGALSGLNAYRRLTLPGLGPAEAFRVVTYQEASTRSLEEFRRSAGPTFLEAGGRGLAPAALIIRTRNRPALLREALESVAAQSQKPRRVVVVNDGGSSVEDAVASVREALPIRLENLPERRGRSAAANLGLAEAGEDLVGFLDDDDLLYPDHFERLLRAVAAGPEPVVYSDAATVRYRRDGEAWREEDRALQYSLDYDPDYLLLANYIPVHTLLSPAGLLRKAGGFDEKLDYSEDWDLLIRLSAETPFRHVRAVTCEYRVFEEAADDGAHVRAGAEAFQKARREILERYRPRRTEEGLARVIDRLRAQISVWYHREGENRRALERSRELEARLAAMESRLARHADLLQANQDYHAVVANLHREIERLTGTLGQIYGSRTWRMHVWLDRLRGR